MNKSWNSKEQVMKKLRPSCEQVVNMSSISNEQTSKKSTIPADGRVGGWLDHTGNNANSAPNWVGVGAWAELGNTFEYYNIFKYSNTSNET